MLDHGHKKEVLETIKKLHLKCGYKHFEHLYILLSRWLYLPQFEKIGEEIYEIYKMPSERH